MSATFSKFPQISDIYHLKSYRTILLLRKTMTMSEYVRELECKPNWKCKYENEYDRECEYAFRLWIRERVLVYNKCKFAFVYKLNF